MARPEGTYTSQVFNFGVDKNIPFGFVDVVFDKSGNAVGFEKDGKFYNLGEKLPKSQIKKELTSDQLNKKKDLLTRKLNLLELQASNTNISDTEKNRYITEFRKTQDELSSIEKSFLETQVREGKIEEAKAKQKVAETFRFDIRRLEERKKLLSKLGKSTLEVDNLIKQKNSELTSVQKKEPIKYASAPTVLESNRPFSGKSVAGTEITSTPITGGVVTDGKVTGSTGVITSGTAIDTNKDKGEKPKSKEELYADAIALASKQYNMPDILFKNVDSLKTLLQRYVDGKLTDNQLKREIELDPWYRQNSAEIKARYVQLFNYEDLVKTGRAQGTTDYEQQLDGIVRKLQARARELNGVEIPDDQAKLIAKDLYIYNLDNDPAILTERLVRFIRPTAGMIGGIPTTGYAGQALQNYQGLQAIAKANGLRIEDLLPRDATGMQQTAEGILEQLALGKIDINRVAQDARKLAALGQPDYVKDLLGQGYDLDSIYSPYRTAMANTLELDQNTISLSDPALRMGISKEGDMNLYDFERSLRKDNRWQYTQQARGEVSDVALRVLRDFGFTG
jgi:hypothetical protein